MGIKPLINRCIGFLLCFSGLWLAAWAGRPKPANQEVLVCGDSQVLIVDYQQSKDSIPAVVWRWDARQAHGPA